MNEPIAAPPLANLWEQLPACMGRDAVRLRQRLVRAEQLLRTGRPAGRSLDELTADLDASIAERARRYRARPRPTFPDDLPVVQKRGEIAAAIAAHQVVVVCGETGSGKTTQLPKICLESGRGVDGMIGHTQPRRIAARSVAARIAAELNTSLGAVVGYKVRFGDRTSPDTYVKLMTDGILLAETQGDRDLHAYDTLIIDEAHERSLNIDFLLGYLKQLLPRRADLKIIVTSATIDPQRFSKHFGDAPIVEVSGRTYPVEVRYRALKSEDPDEDDREQTHGILEAVDELAREGPGDVLVFLPGEREIREAAEELRKHHPPQTEILPLFARLSGDEQSKIFQPHGRRRIVLATNVAETSLTVPGIKYVVDVGTARISRYSTRTKVQRLPIEPISQASANQRKGRCGRVSEGICIRLYSEPDFLARPLFTEPEILRTNLAAVILQMKAYRLGPVEQFPFVEPPDARLIRDGYSTLAELGAVDEEFELTPVGRTLARLPVDPRLGRMILAADAENCMNEVLVIASALSIQDPRERPVELQQVADQAHQQFIYEGSDFLSYLKLWDFFKEKSKHLSNSQLRKQCKAQFLSYRRLREWHEVHQQLHRAVVETGGRMNTDPAQPDNIHRALLPGLLMNVGNKTDTAEYAGPRGAKFFLFPGSSLMNKKPPWIVAAELVETTRLFGRTAAKVTPEWVERAGWHLIKRTYTDPQWNVQRGDVIAGERVTLKGLVLVPHRTVHYGPIDPRTSREVFIHHGLVEGEIRTQGEFFKHNQTLVAQVRLLEAKTRRRDLLAEPQQRFVFYHERVPGDVYSTFLFEKWRKQAERENSRLLLMSMADVARPDIETIHADQFPDELKIGSVTLPLSYLYDYGSASDGVTATLPLALLNQILAGPFEWLVPGLLIEKVTELIRTLPKSIRTRLVPAPDVALRAMAGISPTGPFLDVVSHQLGKQLGEIIPKVAFDVPSLPKHLVMNFRVTDAAGKVVASGRDLQAIKAQLGIKARESFATLPPAEFTRDGLTRWDFADLPEQIEIHRAGATFAGFPALVDRGTSVSLRVLDSRAASRTATRDGVRRLFMLQLEQELKQLARNLDGVEQMALQYKPLGSWAELKDQLFSAAVDRALFDGVSEIRTRDAFVARANDGWRRLSIAVRKLNALAREILAGFQDVSLALSEPFPPLLEPNVRDLRDQLAALVPKSFLKTTPSHWLPHVPRFLKAMTVRLRKLSNAGLARDTQWLQEMRPLWQQYLARRAASTARGLADPALHDFRWRLEELRVSLFAQELRTSQPVSVQRLQKMLDEMPPV